jgi:hypothetical protein
MILNGTALRRFWAKVDKSGDCWLWTARHDRHGYGKFRPNGGHVSEVGAHRVSYVIAHGPIPPDKIVCHTCDNRLCVNPAHLWLGTFAENSADMVRKGRVVSGNTPETAARGERHWSRRQAERFTERYRGERNPAARFTEDDIRAIRSAFVNGETQTSIAVRYGTAQPVISRIVLRLNWKHVV